MEPKSVFFAWQSWSSPGTTRNLIETALKKAVRQVDKDSDAPVILDRDTKGVPGAPHIPAAIREKIKRSSAFVADLAPASHVTVDGHQHVVPNPNVMLETGLAVAEHGWESTILLFNSALGDARQLPFDLDKHRLLQYRLDDRRGGEDEESFHGRRKAVRDSLTGDLAMALRAILGHPSTGYGLIDLCGVVFRGTVERVDGDQWSCRLVAPLHPIQLDVLVLAEEFASTNPRYVSLSTQGIARELAAAPALESDKDEVVATLKVKPATGREPAQAIGQDLDLEHFGSDLGLTPGGVADIPRRLKQVLSTRKGELLWHHDFGSLVADYASDFDYEMLPDLIALEVARLAFVPSSDEKNEPSLAFVNKVDAIRVPQERPDGDWLDVQMDLQVEGVGAWSGTVPIFVAPRGRDRVSAAPGA